MRFTINAAIVLLLCARLQAQTNNQTGSPYSLFGLGRFNDSAPGKTNALGESGIALPIVNEINNLNPAAFASVPGHSFLFDVGGKGESTNYQNADASRKATTFSFSNIALAFALSGNEGIGLTLVPYSDVGYNLTGVTGDIEGSDETYKSNISGSGGMSNVTLQYGRKIGSRLQLGVGAHYLFGNIVQNETASISGDLLVADQKNYYRGFRFVLGAQARISDKSTFAATIKLPTSIKGTRDLDAYKIVDLVKTTLESSVDVPIPDFRLPLEVTVGAHYKFGERVSLNADYRRSFWKATDTRDNIGKFVDADFFGFGLEYTKALNGYRYLDRIRLRAGLNVDNGNLAVNDKRISNYKAVFGLGLPVPGKSASMINLSYGFGQRGAVSETLVKEHYRTFSFNIVLQDIWFLKTKYE